MKWTPGASRKDLDDRRGQTRRGGPALKLGLGGTVLGIAVLLVFGKDYLGVTKSLKGAGGPMAGTSASIAQSPQEEKLVDFIVFALNDIQDTWQREFSSGKVSAAPTSPDKPGATLRNYKRAKLVLFRNEVDSACGSQSKSVGPFYCGADNNAYVDLSFYTELKRRFGAPGDFAQAYVLAHEIGHHVQNITGISARVRQMKRAEPSRKNQFSVRQELQADCFAGIWGHSTKKRDLLHEGDIEEGLNAAAAIGDDRLQKQATGKVTPESWTHGSSKQRMKWFTVGYKTGDFAACNTYDTDRL